MKGLEAVIEVYEMTGPGSMFGEMDMAFWVDKAEAWPSPDTTARRDWRDLTNGALAEAAFREGFRVILTRDRLFGTSARRALAALPELAIVVMTLPQAREEAYTESSRGTSRDGGCER